ncbi:hypothetical protein [Shimia sp.]|uniref:DarT1-associated NADAR antitoxin family protein n=1 Tax=Shimia sp. TaxID=1954381 RepID=UPI003298C1D7
MVTRPVFVPSIKRGSLYEWVPVEFQWHPGFSVSQKQNSIAALHAEARNMGIHPVLEVSTKSPIELGRRLSAFSLKVEVEGQMFFLESVYQSSKVFSESGQLPEIISLDPYAAKKRVRELGKGEIIAFRCFGRDFPTEPKNAFYDWLYIRAIYPHRDWVYRNLDFYGYSDIEFNPQKSINCQARAVAEYKSLEMQGTSRECFESFDTFARLLAYAQIRE